MIQAVHGGAGRKLVYPILAAIASFAMLADSVAPAHAAITTFYATGTLQDGSPLRGTLTIDTTLGSATAVNLTVGAPSNFHFVNITGQAPTGNGYAITARNASSTEDLNFGFTGRQNLVGFTGGSIFGNLFNLTTNTFGVPIASASFSTTAPPPTTFYLSASLADNSVVSGTVIIDTTSGQVSAANIVSTAPSAFTFTTVIGTESFLNGTATKVTVRNAGATEDINFAANVANFVAYGGGPIFGNLWNLITNSAGSVISTGQLSTQSTITYFLPQIAIAGGYQTTLTYVNYSPNSVTCTTNFLSDSGTPLTVPFIANSGTSRTDTLLPGQSIHVPTAANLFDPVQQGWALAVCTGPVQASALFRYFQNGVAAGEASVNASTVPASKFVTFAETSTGVTYGNPSTTQSAIVTLTVVSSAGIRLGSRTVTLLPRGHGAQNLGPYLGIQSFTGYVQITSNIPIVSLSLNSEAFPVFSSLPPGDLPDSAQLAIQ